MAYAKIAANSYYYKYVTAQQKLREAIMLNLLNAIRVSDALFWMLVILGIFLIVEIAIFAILMIYRKHKVAVEEEPRHVTSISLDTQVVRREFKVGEKFDPSGLIVTAHYSDEPYDVTLQEFVVVTPELIKKLAREDKTPEDLLGCRIYVPDLSVEGRPTVNVSFMDQTAAYAISVVEPVVVEEPTPEPAPEPIPEPEPAPVEEIAIAEVVPEPVPEPAPEPIVIAEESFEAGVLRYDRSFTARLIQADNEVKGWYTELKNDLLSYKKVHDRMSWKRESYNFGRQSFARLAFRGETLCLYLPLNPEAYADTKYKVESVSDSTSYADTPCLYRIKNNKRVQYAKELIATVAEQLATPKTERESQDYYVPYEGLVELINKGLIKRNIKDKSSEIFFEKKTQDANN